MNCRGTTPCGVSEKSIQVGTGDPSLLSVDSSCGEVFAAHFSTNLIPTLAGLEKAAALGKSELCDRGWHLQGAKSRPPFDCLVILREPISRFVSHYYHFIQKTDEKFVGRSLSDLSIEELELAIQKSGGNLSVDYLTRHLQQQSVYQYSRDEKLQEAQEVLSTCVVGVLEDWNKSAMMLETAIPWLKGAVVSATSENVARNGSMHEKIEDFSLEKADLLRSSLHADIELYARGLEIYRSQLLHFEIIPDDASDNGIP